MSNEGTAYKHGDRVEARRTENGPWEKGTIAMDTLEGRLTNPPSSYMVRFDGENGSHPIPAARIRRISADPSSGR